MKKAAVALLSLSLTPSLAGWLLACGCDRTPAAAVAPVPRTPIATGTDVNVDLYEKSVDITPNELRHIKEGQRVVVYEDYILVTTSDGRTYFATKGHYTDLSFRADTH